MTTFNELYKINEINEAVLDVIDDIVNRICHFFPYDFIQENYAFDYTNYRDTESEGDASILNESHESEEEDSDAEFDRILELSQRHIIKRNDCTSQINPIKIENEYDLLPKIEQLSIHVDEDIHLEYVGKIADIVDCLVLVKSESRIAFDFDTVFFDESRNAIGMVYDVIGSISDPLYAIRFNTVEEAKEYKKGDSVYFAPKIDQFTHTLFPEQMIKEKIGDDFWDGEGECPVNEMVFSDDESERNFLEGSKKPKENRDKSERVSWQNAEKKPPRKKFRYGRFPEQNPFCNYSFSTGQVRGYSPSINKMTWPPSMQRNNDWNRTQLAYMHHRANAPFPSFSQANQPNSFNFSNFTRFHRPQQGFHPAYPYHQPNFYH